jgi:alkanesulfonate monooxygenase SsuD/methylene tetrahydromethanopterin reductase-like flavin-dependent oxidoreductase (luciferase family)
MLCLCATTTDNVKLATGLAAAFPRSPFELANAMADVDELSGGRALLGLGTGVGEFLEAFHTQSLTKMLARMSDYIEVVRLAWHHLHTGEPVSFAGEHYRIQSPPLNPWGGRTTARDQIPLYLAAMRPKLMELCGRKADGWLGYLATPKFIDERVRPAIEAGAKAAGRDSSEIRIATEVICCVSPDRDVAYDRARKHVGFYVAHPVSDVVAELHGVEDQVAALRGAMMTKGLAAFEETPDELVELFSITGTPEEARQKAAEWEGVFDDFVLHTPYIPPLDAEESEDAYRNIVETFGPKAQTPVAMSGQTV